MSEFDSALTERLARVARQVRSINSFVILVETIGAWWAIYATLVWLGLGKGYATAIGLVGGLVLGTMVQRETDR